MAKKGSLSSGGLGAQYKHKNAALEVKVDTASNVFILTFFLSSNFESQFVLFLIIVSLAEQVSTTFTVTNILPSTKTIASLKFPDYKSGKVPISLACGQDVNTQFLQL